MRFVFSLALALALSGAHAITATKAYVDGATNATLAAAKAYADTIGGVTPTVVTNIASRVTSNVVTKAYVESLGIAACDTNAVQAIINTNVATNYLCSVAAASAMTNAVMSAAEAKFRTRTDNICHANGYSDEWIGKFYDEWEYIADPYWKEEYNRWGCWLYNVRMGFELEFEDVRHGRDASHLVFKDRTIVAAEFNKRVVATANQPFVTYDNVPSTNGLITRAYADSRYAPTNVAATVEGWETYWTGDKVRLSVTNYYGNTSGELPRLRIEEFDHSTTNGSVVSNFFKVVWDEESRHTNYQASVDARVAQISNDVVLAAWMQTASQLAGKAPKAWQSVSSTGGAAPANTVWMTAPNTVFAGGTEYAHVAVGEGGIYVLTANGANVYTEGEEGQFRIKDDSGQNFFGFDVRQSYTLGCRTDAISVNQSQHLVTLTYDLTAAENPSIVTCTNLLTGTWSDCSVTWEQNPPPNTKVCYIDVGTAPHGYYKAEIRYAGGSKFVTNMQADLAGGIAASNTTLGVVQSVYPEITSTGIVWRVKQ